MNAQLDLSQLMGGAVEVESASAKSAKRYLRGGYILLGLLIVGIGGWAALTDIRSAVVAPGVVTVENRPRDIQHLDGGIIAEILVRDGETVTKGDVLMKLDPTVVDANSQILRTRQAEMQARLSRLEAERDGATEVTFPDYVAGSSDPMVVRALEGQKSLFAARKTATKGQVSQLYQRIQQADDQIGGYENRILSSSDQVRIIEDELEGLRVLLEKGYVAKTRVLALERERSRLSGEIATANAEIARIRSSIGETRVQILQTERDRQSEVLAELRQAQTELSEVNEQLTTITDQGQRISVRSPVSGRVLNTAVNTIGEVISPGQVVMQIVPQGERLLIEAQVAPADIDQVYPGQVAKVRMSAFNQRSTPELVGEVLKTAPDRLIDEATGMPYFLVRVTVSDEELARLPQNLELLPGMPAEAFMQTGERSVLSYLVKPAEDAMSRAWREE